MGLQHSQGSPRPARYKSAAPLTETIAHLRNPYELWDDLSHGHPHHARSDETVTGLAPSPTIDPKQAGENPRRVASARRGF